MTNEEYIKQHPEQFKDDIDRWLFTEFGIIGGCCSAEKSHEYAIARMVAEKQQEWFEKNRLAACDRQTEKEAEIESDFVMGIIEKEHRQPTFNDAIKYGMKLKEKEMHSTIELAEEHAMLAGMNKMEEQMMAKAVDAHCFGMQMPGDALFSFRLPADKYLVGSEVKVIVIKED